VLEQLSVSPIRPTNAPAVRRLDQEEKDGYVVLEARSETEGEAEAEPERPPVLLTVISPLEGEALPRGATVVIRWTAHPSVEMGLVRVVLSSGQVLAQNVLDSDRFFWRVTAPISLTHYTIRIETDAQVDGEPLSLVAVSKPFRVVHPSADLMKTVQPRSRFSPTSKDAAKGGAPPKEAKRTLPVTAVVGAVLGTLVSVMGLLLIRKTINARVESIRRGRGSTTVRAVVTPAASP
jgi:hypothetical protein